VARHVELHPEAVAEAEAAAAWYAARSLRAAAAFAHEVEGAIALIAGSPERGLTYLEGTRRILLKRFPFLIVFRVQHERVHVVAVAHGRRRPGYWTARLAVE
jgi:plasmid stabilization system protein ParE